MEELRMLLKRRSLGARAGFDKFAQASGMAADAGRMQPVKAALDRLDYDRALLLLDEAVADGAPAHSLGALT